MKKIKSSSFIIIIMSVIIFLLLGLSYYLFTENKKLDYKMTIGTYTDNNGRLISYPISDKDDYRAILFSLIDANSIEEPAIANKLPDASILIGDSKQGIGYLDSDVWFDNDKIIFNLGGKYNIDSKYKEISGDGVEYIIELISKYKPENNFD